MKKINKLWACLVFSISLILILSFSVSANSPMPADHLRVYISNFPGDAVFADLLIKFPNDDPNYTDFQPSVYGNDKSVVNQIADYSEDGYQSFTLHYKNAKSNIKLEHERKEFYVVTFCAGSEYREYLTQYEDLLNNYRDFKIVLLDKDFKIITVSNAAKLPEDRPSINFYGHIEYNVSQNNIIVDTSVNPYFVLFGGFFSILVLGISVATEFVLALLFRFKGKQLLTVLIVNVVSQFIMRTLYLVLPFPYLIETAIFETLVYTIEFLIYKKMFKEVSTGKILIYTIVANTFSLLFGIILNTYFFA